jgi:FkbM family methyltransferase
MQLQDIIQKLNPKNIWEIGVGNPDICRTKHYLGSDIQLRLFEVNPKTYEELESRYGSYHNVRIYNYGLYDKNDYIEFLEDGDSTCSAEVAAPTFVLGTPKMGSEWVAAKPRVRMFVRDMAEVDPGDIDVALIDTEGCEYKIISRMTSRPRFMSVESHNEWYRTPNYEKLLDWLKENNYKLIHTDVTDSWYLRGDIKL